MSSIEKTSPANHRDESSSDDLQADVATFEPKIELNSDAPSAKAQPNSSKSSASSSKSSKNRSKNRSRSQRKAKQVKVAKRNSQSSSSKNSNSKKNEGQGPAELKTQASKLEKSTAPNDKADVPADLDRTTAGGDTSEIHRSDSQELLATVSQILEKHLAWEDQQAELAQNQSRMMESLAQQQTLLEPMAETSESPSSDAVNQLEQRLQTLETGQEKVQSDVSMMLELLMEQNETLAALSSPTSDHSSEHPSMSLDSTEPISQLVEQMQLMGSQSDKLEQAMTASLELLSSQHEQLKEGFADISKRVEQIGSNAIESGPAPTGPTESGPGVLVDPPAEAAVEKDPAAEWNARKADILAQYGIEPEQDTSEPASIDTDRAHEMFAPGQQADTRTSQADNESQDEQEEPVAENVEHEEIERLRTELESKLREAEIDISIERAKIARMQSELEQKRNEFEQESQAMKARGEDKTGGEKAPEKTKMLTRLSRWLPRKSRD